DRELRQALLVQRQRLRRLDVEETAEVDDEERRRKDEHDERRPRHELVALGDPAGDERDQKEEREDVGQVHAPRDVPVDVLERDREHGREEEEGCEPPADLAHATSFNRSANSCERVRRESSSFSSGGRLPFSRAPFSQRARRPLIAAFSAGTSSGATTTPACARRTSSAATPSGGTAARIGRSAARYS